MGGKDNRWLQLQRVFRETSWGLSLIELVSYLIYDDGKSIYTQGTLTTCAKALAVAQEQRPQKKTPRGSASQRPLRINGF
jgi:hypothetical protein